MQTTIESTFDKFKIYIELLVVNSDQIKVIPSKTSLLIKRVKKTSYKQSNFILNQQLDKCVYVSFKQSFNISDKYDYNSTTVEFKNGILRVELSKIKTVVILQLKKITVKILIIQV